MEAQLDKLKDIIKDVVEFFRTFIERLHMAFDGMFQKGYEEGYTKNEVE